MESSWVAPRVAPAAGVRHRGAASVARAMRRHGLSLHMGATGGAATRARQDGLVQGWNSGLRAGRAGRAAGRDQPHCRAIPIRHFKAKPAHAGALHA
ncbi:hypothetical protein [Acidovorax sp. NCPPB 3576]|uniref:hypothetical protein n=1 Tax=Acidovorax sp. NCPPB 3576 TaxID=2940488 RepID=UPI00234993F0|nr:hypothetical protein [Acidovorax sp. NCPPB 3576]WCM88712.1 hypothetical protein M5C98_01210 [Acidovorax sp. NCPPB 3576]